jgi:hypothetical protein
MRSVPAGLVLAVAVIQLAHLIYFEPFVGTYGDTVGYVNLANTILAWPTFAIYYQPLYPAFLRVAVLLTDAEHFRRLVVLVQMAMVVATCLLIYAITRRLTDRRWLGAAAALLVALDIRITIFEYLLLTEILAIFLSVLLIYALTRALLDDSRPAAVLAALSLLALALTKVSYVILAFAASLYLGLLAWRFRDSARAAALRRCAVAFSIAALVLAGKLITAYAHTGMVSGNSGVVLQHFLSINPEIVLGLPDGDPALAKFKQAYEEQGHFLFVHERLGGVGPVATHATMRIYARAVLGNPVGAIKAALKGYYRQTSHNYLFIYPEETNFRAFQSSPNPLFAIERAINRTIFGGWPSVIWNTLCLVLALLCLFTALPAPQKIALALLLGFIFYTIGLSTWTFGGHWIADNSRMRLMYEAPLIALWVFVPYWLLALARRPAPAHREAAA